MSMRKSWVNIHVYLDVQSKRMFVSGLAIGASDAFIVFCLLLARVLGVQLGLVIKACICPYSPICAYCKLLKGARP